MTLRISETQRELRGQVLRGLQNLLAPGKNVTEANEVIAKLIGCSGSYLGTARSGHGSLSATLVQRIEHELNKKLVEAEDDHDQMTVQAIGKIKPNLRCLLIARAYEESRTTGGSLVQAQRPANSVREPEKSGAAGSTALSIPAPIDGTGALQEMKSFAEKSKGAAFVTINGVGLIMRPGLEMSLTPKEGELVIRIREQQS